MKPADKILWAALVVLLLLQATGGGTFTPKVSGPARVVIVHETADVKPSVSALINSLRTGPSADYLSAKGHRLDILDDDAVDEHDKPVVAADWIAGVQLPAVVVLDGKSRQAIYREPLPATAEQLIDWLKSKGL